jgi:hypothetical protein
VLLYSRQTSANRYEEARSFQFTSFPTARVQPPSADSRWLRLGWFGLSGFLAGALVLVFLEMFKTPNTPGEFDAHTAGMAASNGLCDSHVRAIDGKRG